MLKQYVNRGNVVIILIICDKIVRKNRKNQQKEHANDGHPDFRKKLPFFRDHIKQEALSSL